MRQQFSTVAERIVDAMLAESPVLAQTAGDHRYDDRLPDLSPDGVARHVALLRDAADALSQVDTDALTPEEAVDCTVLLARVERTLFELTEVREHEWNPMAHNPGGLLHPLLSRPFAPVEERLTALAARLTALPDTLATARAVLRDVPRIHLETAIGQFTGLHSLIRGEADALLREEPGLRATVNPAQETAAAAIDEFVAWLRAQQGEGRDPRLGRRLWEARLWHTLDTELTAAQIIKSAGENLERISEEIRETAAAMTGAPATDDAVREALQRSARDRPDNTSIVERARQAMAEATAFVDQFELVSLVDDPCEILEMPEFARGIAVAYCDPPGLLESGDLPTFYCISPTPADWPAERVDSFYREYNDHMIRNLTVHEAMPGHFLQLAHARRAKGARKVRAVSRSGPFVEGWAVYAEELMVEHGYGGRAVKLQQLKMQLRMTINAIIDQLVHCADMSEQEALALMRGSGFQEEGEAVGKWRRALLTSTQLSTYFVGYLEVAAIARARPANTPLRDWHDAMLSHGSPPPRHLRALLNI
ncbi:DUF885 domain-containing protein [Virgisporangium aliadipatigenens]|nr:DUF885 domain-containing protein [Virgisporangium aliadipatigenens]